MKARQGTVASLFIAVGASGRTVLLDTASVEAEPAGRVGQYPAAAVALTSTPAEPELVNLRTKNSPGDQG